ncbi:hypothetical protein [Flavobacterium sp.]|uniref:hypothetical protein n=1 Tax=Flavobacterium sp. TaxID=239 RepID=UPI003752F16B
MKILNDFFSVIGVLLAFLLIFSVYNCKKQDNFYNNQKLGVNIDDFKKTWENPDKEIYYKNEIILFYDNKLNFGDTYVFKFDLKTKNLSDKFYDD